MKYVAALVVFGMLLLAGCEGAPTQQNVSGPGQPTPSQPAQPATPAQPAPSVPTQPEVQSLLGMGFAQLVALGMPVRCTVTTTEGGRSITTNLWLRGSNFRTETRPPEMTEPIITVVRGGETYLQVGAQMKQAFAAMGKNCDWLRMTPQEAAQPPAGGAEAASASELESIPPTNFQCNPDVFGDEKFATPGSVCSYADLLGGLMPPQPPPESQPPGEGLLQQCLSACALLPADQQAQCQQNCAAAAS
ncbi:MAG: hypothetical protein QXH27_00230 [Candidatus Micrarchaeia archaeon]